MTHESDGVVVPVMNDDQLRRFLSKTQRNENGALPWLIRNDLDQALGARIASLGVSLVEGDGCWIWTGARSDSGKRPQAWVGPLKTGVEAYRVSYAAYIRQPLPEGAAVHIHHNCPDSLCVRPGGRHSGPLTPEAHTQLEAWLKQGEENPESAALRTPEGFASLEIGFEDDKTT